MINSAALLPSLSRSSGLSPRSSIGLNIIRRDSIAVDRLLKERLVLSKVRYGIERQQQERERRRNREADLEADSKQNYEVGDAPNDPRKRRKGIGGLLGTVFGGILSSLGGVAFQTFPAFLLARRKIIGGGTNFNRSIGATDGLLNTIKGQKGPFDTLRKVKLDPVKNIGKTITKFGNSLTLFVNSSIAGQIGGRAIDRFRTPAQVKAQVAQSAKRQKIRSKIIATETIRQTVKESATRTQRVVPKVLVKEKAKVLAGSVEQGSDLSSTNIRNRASKKISVSAREFIPESRTPTPLLDQDVIDKADSFARKKGKIRVQPDEIIPIQRKVRDRTTGITEVRDDLFIRNPTGSGSSGVKVESISFSSKDGREIDQFFIDDDVSSSKAISDLRKNKLTGNFKVLGQEYGEDFKNLSPEQQLELGDILRENENFKRKARERTLERAPRSEINTPEARARRFKQSFGKPTGADPFTGKGTYQTTPTITSFDPETGVTTVTLTKGREFDPITGEIKAKKRTVKASKVTGKKGLGKFMANIGGAQFLKPIRKFLGEAIGAIPFVGDLVAFLLDIFVFGEPPGRAAFMAIGSILGAFLGGLAGSIGGPPGVFLGGLIGGIGGDLLGGALYNLLFGGGQAGFGERAPKSILKSSVKAGLYTGGEATFGKYLLGEKGPEYVIDSDSYRGIEEEAPGFLAALNDADAGEVPEVLRSYASYEGPAGRERIVPVPIPQKEDTGKQEIMIMESTSMTASSPFTQHYRRG